MWISAKALAVTSEERAVLEEFVRSGNTPQRVAFRIGVVLGAAEGLSNNELARRWKTTRTTVLKWRTRFAEAGIEALLNDAPGRGRKKQIGPEQEAAIVKATLQTKPAQSTHWSTRTMATAQGVSDTTVLRIWHAHRLQPHRVQKFKASRDPDSRRKSVTLSVCI